MKPQTVRLAAGLALFLCLLLPLSARAQEEPPGYQLSWWTMESGGGGGSSSSTGGNYSLAGTLGQPDVDPEPATGGSYGLNGGFWLGAPGLVIAVSVNNPTPWEGETITYTVRVSNTGTASATRLTVTDSQAGTLATDLTLADGLALTYVYTATVADGPQTVIHAASARSAEDPGGVVATRSVNWLNRPPTAQAGGPYTVAEGGSVGIRAAGTDVPGDPLTFAWDLNGDGTFETTGQSPLFDAINLDGPTTVTVTVQVQDDDGGVTPATAQVMVSNVAPTVDAGADWLYPPSGRVRVDAPITDPGLGDSHTASVDWGDGVVQTAPVINRRVQSRHLYGQGVYTATITVQDDDGGSGTDSFWVTVGQPLVYLPQMYLSGPELPERPDLVVTELLARADGLQITLFNQGSVSVEEDFWVDLYINPQPAPSHVNQLWPELSTQGGVWGVLQDLAPGESMTLFVGDAFYFADLSNLPEVLAAGTQLYVQVDSANADTTYGGVLEGHESEGGPYNNVIGPVTLSQAVTLPVLPVLSADRRPQGPAMPERPSGNP